MLLDANIPKENHDHELKGKLDEEQAGILAWAVQGCLEWQNEGLKPPAKVENARKVYREDMDEVRQFLADNVAEQKGSSITVGSLYDSYQMWADDERIEPANKKTFGKRLKELGYEQHRTKEGRFWSNVRITSGLEAEFEEEDEAA